MASVRLCDNCGSPITSENPIMAKLYFTPVVVGRTRSQHSHYTAHMDIGLCCKRPILSMKWQRRKVGKKVATNGS